MIDDARAIDEFHRGALVIDLHADTMLQVRYLGRDLARRGRPPRFWNPHRTHFDLPRAREGGLRAQGFGIVCHPPKRTAERSLAHALRTIDLFEERVLKASPAEIGLALGPDDIERLALAEPEKERRIAAFLCLEGGHMLGSKLESVALLHGRGVRSIGLVHLASNDLCPTSSRAGKGAPPGLSAFGRAVIAEMNRLGMIVDLAHCHESAFLEAVDASRDPVVVTHGGCHALNAYHRNLTDGQIRAIARSGGLVGVIFFPWYLERHGLRTPLDRVLDHMDHIRRVTGSCDAIALGSDFDGFIWTVRGLDDVSRLPALTRALFRRGYGEDDVRKVLGLNFLRVWKRVVKGTPAPPPPPPPHRAPSPGPPPSLPG